MSPIHPEAMSVGELLASCDVWMDTPVAPAVTAPIVSPLTVTVTAALAPMDDDPVSVNTIAVDEGAAAEAVPALKPAVGEPAATKKPDG